MRMGRMAVQAPAPGELMALLVEIECQSRVSAPSMLQVTVAEDTWEGLAYSIAGVRVVTAMSEIREMRPCPVRLTHVPGAQPWMKGLANIRGNLLPVIDLQVFLGGKSVMSGKSVRVLIVRMRGLECGLLVSAVLGMRHFPETRRLPNARMTGALGRYVFDAFSVEDEVWPVFSLSALTADPAFRSAGR